MDDTVGRYGTVYTDKVAMDTCARDVENVLKCVSSLQLEMKMNESIDCGADEVSPLMDAQ